MLRMSDFRIAVRLPAAIAGLVLVGVVATGLFAYQRAATQLTLEAQAKLEAVRAARIVGLESFLEGIEQDINVLAQNHQVIDALEEFDAAWEAFGASATGELQRLYVTQNPNPAGEKHRYDRAPGDNAYNDAHAAHHPWFRKVLEERGYYDIFLLNEAGDVVYSVYKEADYATSMATGRWRDSDLGTVYRNTMARFTPGAIAFTDFAPYAPSNDAPASFMATPVFDRQGERQGLLIFQMPIGKLNEIMQLREGMGESGESFIVGEDKLMRSDSRFSEESTILKQEVDTETARLALAGETGVMITPDYRGTPVLSAYDALEYQGVTWAVLAEIDEAEVMAPVVSMRNAMAGSGLVILLVAAGLGFLFARGIAGPIGRMTVVMSKLADGDRQVEVPHTDHKDEIGNIAQAVQVFKDNAIKMDELTAEQENQVERDRQAAAELRGNVDSILEVVSAATEGDLTQEVTVHGEDAIGQMGEGLGKFFGDLRGSMGTIGENSQSLASAAEELTALGTQMGSNAEETTSQAGVVSSAATQVSANVQTVATSAEELAASIKEIAQNASHAAEVATNAVQLATETNTIVVKLGESSADIGDVIKVITSIAAQTNLLALNATIEAASAGDAGKGFAVVAHEVKELAGESAKAAEDISKKIEAIQTDSKAAVDAIGEIGGIIAKINDIQSTIASAVEEQIATTNEIGRNVGEAAKASNEIAENINGVASAAQNTSEGVTNSLKATTDLSRMAGELQTLVGRFKYETNGNGHDTGRRSSRRKEVAHA